jgi:hypothetical protein
MVPYRKLNSYFKFLSKSKDRSLQELTIEYGHDNDNSLDVKNHNPEGQALISPLSGGVCR